MNGAHATFTQRELNSSDTGTALMFTCIQDSAQK